MENDAIESFKRIEDYDGHGKSLLLPKKSEQIKMDYNDDDCEVMMDDIPEAKADKPSEDDNEVKFEVIPDTEDAAASQSVQADDQKFEVVEVLQ